MPYAARVDVEIPINKKINMKKTIMILIMVTTGFICFGQQDSVYTGTQDSVKSKAIMTEAWRKATLSEEIETGRIYNSMSPHHNILHEFTLLVATRDYCDKTLLQMRANGKVNKKRSKELKKELSNAKAELASSKYNGLKIESGMYEVFLKQINDRFKD
jgi:hypothetical protein